MRNSRNYNDNSMLTHHYNRNVTTKIATTSIKTNSSYYRTIIFSIQRLRATNLVINVIGYFLIIVTLCDHRNYSCAASVQVAQPETPQQAHEQLLSSDKLQIQVPKDQIPLVRLPSNTLLKYTAYKDVSILHFRIPADTRTALFTFKAYEESKSAFQRVCQPRDITLHLKAGSYPVISPENITFPKHFLSAGQRFEIYNLQFKSNGRTQRLTIDGPQSGNWFAVAFISWTDPNNERIEQQGLAASCETLLLSEMSVARSSPIIINSGQIHSGTLQTIVGLLTMTDQPTAAPLPSPQATSSSQAPNTNNVNMTASAREREITYKFYVPRNVAIVRARIMLKALCLTCPEIGFYVQANALPTTTQYIHHARIYPNQTGDMSFEFYVQSGSWHFIELTFLKDNIKETVMGGPPPTTTTSTFVNTAESFIGQADDREQQQHEDTVNGTLLELDYTLQVDYRFEVDQQDLSSSPLLSAQFESPEKPVLFRDIEFYPLLRQTYREFFMFDYDLLPDPNGTVPTYLNLTASTPVGFRFDVGDVYDIGGTLSFAIAMKSDVKGVADLEKNPQGGVLAEKLVDKKPGAAENASSVEKPVRGNQTIVVCMRLGEAGIPTLPDRCKYGDKTLPASSVINNTDPDTSTGLIHVPFPESGQWFITMGLFCHGPETTARVTIIDSVKEFVRKYVKLLDKMKAPCSCAETASYYKSCIDDKKCFMQMNETETLKIKECLMDNKCTENYEEMTEKFEIHHKYATEQSVTTDNCSSSIVFTISSSPCVAGRCGRYGRCYHYMSGGFVFSTCLCIKGYRGWDCTEDAQVPSSISILVASLLLTLSNLLFIPSIYFAIRRKYYTESVIYFFAMFFSIFYHACDSGEDEYSFCLVKIGVLQFCDFYCGLLAIWVTLIAMAHIRQQFVSLLHMIGAIVLAFGTELNKQSLWVFLAPALTGICLISASWGIRCRKTRKIFPDRKYWTIFMPIGTVLVMVGLICYAFLQTKQNYHIVHSIWHMLMALSLLCLLPSRSSFLPKC